jgi:hypothetical protein
MEIAVQRFSTYWIVSLTLRATEILLRDYKQGGEKCCTIPAIRYYAAGINARGQDENVYLSTPNV